MGDQKALDAMQSRIVLLETDTAVDKSEAAFRKVVEFLNAYAIRKVQGSLTAEDHEMMELLNRQSANGP